MTPDSGSTLAFAGRLEAIPLADLLQLIAAGRRGGVLWVQDEASGTAGEIELCNGRVVGARVSAAAAPWKPLGQLLVEMGELEPAALRRGLSEQIVHSTATIMGWRRGVFRFRLHDGGSARTRAAALEVALEPHELVLEAARLADEAAAPAGVH